MRASAILLLMAAGSLAGCISGKPPLDTYTSPATGETTVIESNVEMCQRSCNDDYTRCMEGSLTAEDLPGVPQATPGVRPGVMGVSGDCTHELRDCLPRCKSQ
jgi:hypothetical protein